MIVEFLLLLTILIFAHCVADFPLQGDYMAREKHNSHVVMAAHCMIHAGFVLLFTWSIPAMLFQFTTHYVIDTMKVRNLITFNMDQALHIVVLILTAAALSFTI